MTRNWLALSLIGAISLFATAQSGAPSVSVARWPQDRTAAISLTFDDGIDTHLDHVGPILKKHHLNGTFFVATALGPWEKRKAEWKQLAADGNEDVINAQLAFAYYGVGDYERARAACESADEGNKPGCFALVYHKLGRQADAEAILAKMRAECGDVCAIDYAGIYLAWGDPAHSLDWLETAMRLREPYLVNVKADREWDPLRKEPRFQAIERALKFPD